MHPSTKRTAQIGGFVAGGSGGVGSVTFGGMREPGNIVAARIVTLEDEAARHRAARRRGAEDQPRLRHDRHHHRAGNAAGAGAGRGSTSIVAFDDFVEAVRFGHAIAMADGIVKKLLTPVQWPVPQHFAAFRPHCPDGKSLLHRHDRRTCRWRASRRCSRRCGGAITYKAPSEDVLGKMPLYEHTWNHTTLQVLKNDRGVTYLQCLYPHDRLVDAVARDRREIRRRSVPASRVHPLQRLHDRERHPDRALLRRRSGSTRSSPATRRAA